MLQRSGFKRARSTESMFLGGIEPAMYWQAELASHARSRSFHLAHLDVVAFSGVSPLDVTSALVFVGSLCPLAPSAPVP
jgi:hypothetical protein